MPNKPRMCHYCPGTCGGPAGADGVYLECASSDTYPTHPRVHAEIVTRDGNKGVLCRCDTFVAFDAYCIAQMAMKHVLSRDCRCGFRVEVRAKRRGDGYMIVRQNAGGRFATNVAA